MSLAIYCCAYPRSYSNGADACSHILGFPRLMPVGILVVIRTALTLVLIYSDSIPSAYACGYPRSCSNFALLVFTYSDSSPWRCHPIKMEGRSQYIAARILVVVQTSRCSFSHTRIRHRGDAIQLKWDVIANIGDGYFFAGLCRLWCRLAVFTAS